MYKLQVTTWRQYRDTAIVQSRSHFRLSRSAFEKLLQLLEPSAELFTKNNNGGKDPVPIAKQLLVFLWYNSNSETLRAIADRFDQVRSCILSCIRRVTRAIKNELSALLIEWPTGRRAQEVMEGFQR